MRVMLNVWVQPKQVALVTNRGIQHVPVVFNNAVNRWEARFTCCLPTAVEGAYGVDGRGRYRGPLITSDLDFPLHLDIGVELLIAWDATGLIPVLV